MLRVNNLTLPVKYAGLDNVGILPNIVKGITIEKNYGKKRIGPHIVEAKFHSVFDNREMYQVKVVNTLSGYNEEFMLVIDNRYSKY